jgi:hypothetical protein
VSGRLSGDHLPIGTTRPEVIQGLVRGITPDEAREARTALLKSFSKIGALVVIAVAIVVALERDSSNGILDILWSHPLLILATPVVPVCLVIQYRRLRPRAPMTLEAAEAFAPPGTRCPRCDEIPLSGAPICPRCHNLLRPLVVVLPGALLLVGALLVLLFRRGAFLP